MYSPPRGPTTWYIDGEVPWQAQATSPEFSDGSIGFDAYLSPNPTSLVPSSPPNFSCGMDIDIDVFNSIHSTSTLKRLPPQLKIFCRVSEVDALQKNCELALGRLFLKADQDSFEGQTKQRWRKSLLLECCNSLNLMGSSELVQDFFYKMAQYISALEAQVAAMRELVLMFEVIGLSTHEKLERKGRTTSVIIFEDLQQHFGSRRGDAAKSLGVSESTLKRICRKHGILRWPFRKKNNGNCSPFELKLITESIHGAEGPFNPSLSSLPVAVGSNHQNSPGSKPSDEQQGEKNTSPTTCKTTPSTDGQAEIGYEMLEHLQEENGFLPDFIEGLSWSNRVNGPREESIKTPTSHDSGPANYPAMDSSISSTCKETVKAGGPSELAFQLKESISLAAYPNPNAPMFTQPQIASREMLIENVGYSKDLRMPSAAEAFLRGQVSESSWTVPMDSDPAPRQAMTTVPHIMTNPTATQDMRTVMFKATYRSITIRFRLSMTSGIVELKEEVAKRLELELGSFNVEYQDEDQDWVLMACDADLQDCLTFSSSSGNQVIRLRVLDKVCRFQEFP